MVGDSYEGEWADDEMSGEGVMRYKNGNVYAGVLRRSVKHGPGKMTWASGDTYEGEWEEGLLHGRGVFKYADKGEYDGRRRRAAAARSSLQPPTHRQHLCAAARIFPDRSETVDTRNRGSGGRAVTVGFSVGADGKPT